MADNKPSETASEEVQAGQISVKAEELEQDGSIAPPLPMEEIPLETGALETEAERSAAPGMVNRTNGSTPLQKELPIAPSSPTKPVHSDATPSITLNPSEVDVPASPPPPPPKPQSPTSLKSPPPNGRPGMGRTETETSMQEVELSRNGTPTPGSTDQRTSHPASSSVTSLHSITSSAQTPSRPPSTRPSRTDHSRRSSTATTLSLSSMSAPHARSPQLSTVLITPPLQVLVDSKEAKKSASFSAAAKKALELCQDTSNSAYLHPREIFEPLRLAISNPQTTSVPTLITSLDLLSKLISHSFFSEPNGPPKGLSPLPDLITHTITLAYSESSPPQVALQVVKALMAIVLSTDKGMLVHQSSLLKAIRTVYNVFLLSPDASNQVVAQGGLTQMVHHVFGRVVRPDPKAMRRSMGLSENEARRVGLGMGMESERGTPTKSGRETPVATPKEGNGELPKMTL